MTGFERGAALLIGLALLGCGVEDPAEGDASAFHYPRDGALRLNELQALATHNSYRIRPESMTITELLYDHVPLEPQLSEQGIRAFELDIRYDEELEEFAVFHLPLIDAESHCPRLVDCLSTLEAWSRKNPAHHPLFVQIEPKDSLPTDAEPRIALLESELLSVWPRARILTPDDVRNTASTLALAIASDGWPTLGETRGKVVFFVDDSGAFRERYTRGGQDLNGRLMFVDSSPGDSFAAFAVLNDPITREADIAAALAAGLIVRTRADSDNVEPFAGDVSRRDRAFDSGAQIVSTDYPVPTEGVDYVARVPGGTPSRCNPVTAPAECASTDIEDPKFIR